MSRFQNKVISDTFWYTLGDIINHSASFILIPLYTSLLSVEEYGIISIGVIYLTAIKFIIGFSVKSGYYRLLFDYSGPERKELTFTAIVNSLVLTTILICLILIVKSLDVYNNFLTSSIYELIELLILISFFYSINEVFLSLLKYLNQSKFFVALNLLRIVAEVGFFLLLLDTNTSGVLSKFIALAIAFITSIFFFIIFGFRKEIVFKYDSKKSKTLLIFTAPLIINDLIGWAIISVDQLIFERYFGLERLAILTLGFQVISIYKYGMEGILKAINNQIFRYNFNELNDLGNKIIRIFIHLFTLGALGLITIKSPLTSFFGSGKYESSLEIIELFIVPKFLLLVVTIIGFFMLAEKKPHSLLFASTTSLILIIILSPILIPKYGELGAAISSVISIVTRLFYMLLIVKYTFHIKKLDLLKTIFLSSILITTSIYISDTIFYSIFLLLIYSLFFFFLEKKTISYLLKKI